MIQCQKSYVRISEDEMTAWLYLCKPVDKPDYTREEIIAFLRANLVVCGYHSSNIAAMANKHVYEREIVVANGILPKKGVDGHYDYFFTPEGNQVPTVLSNGNGDYSSMNELQNVKKGDAL